MHPQPLGSPPSQSFVTLASLPRGNHCTDLQAQRLALSASEPPTNVIRKVYTRTLFSVWLLALHPNASESHPRGSTHRPFILFHQAQQVRRDHCIHFTVDGPWGSFQFKEIIVRWGTILGMSFGAHGLAFLSGWKSWRAWRGGVFLFSSFYEVPEGVEPLLPTRRWGNSPIRMEFLTP